MLIVIILNSSILSMVVKKLVTVQNVHPVHFSISLSGRKTLKSRPNRKLSLFNIRTTVAWNHFDNTTGHVDSFKLAHANHQTPLTAMCALPHPQPLLAQIKCQMPGCLQHN